MKKLPIHPTITYMSKRVMLKMEGSLFYPGQSVYFNFAIVHSKNNDEDISGYALFYIDNGGIFLEGGIDSELDMDLDEQDKMKITGVDML
jgi:hypothetical protein